MKICLACSLGGHLTEIMQLKPLYSKYEHFFITEENAISRNLAETEKTLFLKQINRRMARFPLIFMGNVLKSYRYLKSEDPDIIISTGALCSFSVLLLGKLRGKKIVFIESFANIKKPTLTGRLIYPFTDLFIVQWEGLKKYYPKAVNGGAIF